MNTERKAQIEKIRQLPDQLAALLDGLAEEQLTTQFIPGEWSVAQNVHHLFDSHLHSYLRCKLILTETHPTLKPYDQNVWAQLPDATTADCAASLSGLRGLHGRWVTFWQSLPDDAWERTAYHPESGVVTLADQLRYYAAHGEGHVYQIAHTLVAQPDVSRNLTAVRLLAMAKAERFYFANVLAQVDEARLEEPGVEADWSVKDIVHHVTTWEGLMAHWLAEAVRGIVPERPQSDNDIEQMNAGIFAAGQSRPPADVLAEFQAGEQTMITAVRAVPETDLLDPNRFAWRKGSPLWHLVGGNTFWHYPEHANAIRAWLAHNG
jgi:hypothetical protein